MGSVFLHVFAVLDGHGLHFVRLFLHSVEQGVKVIHGHVGWSFGVSVSRLRFRSILW